MEDVRTFLESSTIHGLSYLSSTRKYARLFWLCVILCGFSGACFLIYKSFHSWAESPVRTTVETLPISELKFPKVTVCPPRNTYTDLNYDLMLAENVSLTENLNNETDYGNQEYQEYEFEYWGFNALLESASKIRTKNDELYEFAKAVVKDHLYMDVWILLQEENRFYNWYHGYTKIVHPVTTDYDIKYKLDTSAASGVIFTQYFGEQFQPNLLNKDRYKFDIYLYPTESIKNNENITLHITVQKVSMQISTKLSTSIEELKVDGKLLEDKKSFTFQYKPPGKFKNIYYRRQLHYSNIEDLSEIEMDLMPGFKLSWHYTGAPFQSDQKYLNDKMTRNLRRKVNAIAYLIKLQ